jgi:hypothetical protein
MADFGCVDAGLCCAGASDSGNQAEPAIANKKTRYFTATDHFRFDHRPLARYSASPPSKTSSDAS